MTPEGWRTDRLGSLLDGIDAGWSPQCEGRPANDDEWGVLKVSAVTSGVYRPTENKALPSSQVPKPELEVHDGDLLLARANGVLELVGRTAIVRHTRPRLMLSDKILRIRPRNATADAAFLHALLSSSSARDRLTTVTGGSHMRNISQGALRDLHVCCPPLGEQRKIAAILSSVDDAIEATQAVIDQLQVVKKAMMTELLTRGLPGRHTRFKKTEIGEVPEEWHIASIGELAEFSGGKGFTPRDWASAGLPIIRIQNLNGSKDFNYYAGQPDDDWLVQPGTLLFAWAGSRGASFGPCIWPGPLGVLNQHIHRLAPDRRRVSKLFMYYLLRLVTEEVEKRAHGFKDTLVHLRKSELTGWPVALPPLNEQEKIVELLEAIGSRISVEQAALESLKSAKTTLAQALLTGEIRVTPDEAAP
ncbi:restriction endonuclease subunit S [Sorangium atrum]|uniref:Restriction endonuclease subunit S n=1 Tax=Sorangium atrum TaxID=2995308 RepID=A0ABT5BZE1_9BACT|nr:restriction endonuclease subunit S [Sorangium aterium]MDC0678985.1 restriction endonuclease subunit S [Sorangium aterium]